MHSTLLAELTVKEVLERYPQLLQLFVDMGLLCVGCPAESFHSLTEVAHEYGLDLEQFLQRVNAVIDTEKSS